MNIFNRIPTLAAFVAILSLLAGCGGSNSAVNSPATATLSTSTLSFPNTATASTSASLTVTISNTGSSSLTVSSAVAAPSGTFTVSQNGCSTVSANSTCTIQVTFSPAATQNYTGTLTITDSVGTQTVALSGTGIPNGAAITFSSTTLSAGQILAGSIVPMLLTVTNSGNAALTFSGNSISGTSSSSFTVTTNTCTSAVAAGNSCQLVVTYNPSLSATGSASAVLNVGDNVTGSPQTIALTGTAVTESNSCKSTNDTSPAQTPPTTNYAGTAFSGKVMAGALPVIGASVKIYSAGTMGNGSAPTLLSTQTTSAAGTFSVPAGITCPYSNSVLYAVSSGGQAGATGTVNAGLELATVLGICSSITGSPAFTINEVTTAATVWSMSQFMATGGKIGATSTNSIPTNNTSGIVLAAGTFANLVNPLTGTAPGMYFPATGTAPTAKINSLANLLNTCTASTGATSAGCTQLYTNTTSALTPANTLDAAMNLVQNPGTNVGTLYTLSTNSTVYSPALTAPPADWTLFVTYAGAGMDDPSAISIDSTGRVWVANYFYVASVFSNTGTPVFPNGITGNGFENSYGGAVDTNDVFWITNEQSPGGVNSGLGSVTLQTTVSSPATYSAGGLDFPIAIAFDTSGLGWVVDYGNSHVTILNNAGMPQSGTTGYTTSQYVFPVAVAVDSKCNAYVTNQSSNTITFTSADGTTFGSYATGNGPSGIAIDSANNVWVANYYDNSLGYVTSAGSVGSGSGYTGGGIDHPQGIAVDGKNRVWVANYRSPAGQSSVLSELAGSNSLTTPGAVLSPTAGWGGDAGLLEPFAVAIDASGNLWITNFGSNTLTEFVGLAAPVKTPLLGPVRVP